MKSIWTVYEQYMNSSLNIEILGADDSEYKEYCLLACDALQIGALVSNLN
jgi:hypothetical protein